MARKKRDISQALLKAIEQKLGVKRRSLDYRIQTTKKKYNVDSDEEAVCLICFDEKVNISPENPNYYDPKKGYAVPQWAIDHAKRILSAGFTSQTQESSRKATTLGETALKVKSPPDIKIPPDPILQDEKLEEAILMARKVYPYIYTLENSIREFIKHVMENQLYPDQNWWIKGAIIPSKVYEGVENTINSERQNPWLGGRARNVHPIYYTFLGHLSQIITHSPNWRPQERPDQGFEAILGDEIFIKSITHKITSIRNNIMHSNPIKRNIINKAKQVLQEWQESPAVMKYGSKIT